jgi:GTP-binding protein EngB required for normal cell division
MEQVKIAISGRGATGKSTFINTIRNVKPGDEGFAEAGSGDTTKTPTLYKHPTNDQITFCDLPGYASTIFKKEDYGHRMNRKKKNLSFKPIHGFFYIPD